MTPKDLTTMDDNLTADNDDNDNNIFGNYQSQKFMNKCTALNKLRIIIMFFVNFS